MHEVSQNIALALWLPSLRLLIKLAGGRIFNTYGLAELAMREKHGTALLAYKAPALP